MLKLLMICFVYKIYFNLGELGRFVVDQYEVAATAQNLAAVNVALNSGALKVPTATSIRQKGKLGWTAFLKAHPLYTDEWAANIVLMTTSHPDLLLWAQTITFKDYTWTARIGAFQAHFSSDAHIGHVTAGFLAWVMTFTVNVPTSEQATFHIKLSAIIQSQQYTRAEVKVRGMSTSPWK